MGNTGVYQRSKLHFSLELHVEDVMGYVNDLNHFELLPVAVEFLRFNLHILLHSSRVKTLTLALIMNELEDNAF